MSPEQVERVLKELRDYAAWHSDMARGWAGTYKGDEYEAANQAYRKCIERIERELSKESQNVQV